MRLIRALTVAVVLGASLGAPRALAAQSPADSAAVLDAVQALFDAMAARDSVALAQLVTAPGTFAVVVLDHDSVVGIEHPSLAGFISSVGRPGPALLERAFEPRVLVDGPFAAVWTRYDFHVDGRFSHCGVDVFTLARVRGAWRITGGSYTIRRQGCETPGGG